MKKFLFTLAALLTASTALADSGFFFGTFDQSTLGSTNESTLVLTPEDLTGELVIPMGAYWSARVSGTDCSITFPEGMHATFAKPGADCSVNTLNSLGHAITVTPLFTGLVEPYNHWLAVFFDDGYYYNEDGELEGFGATKWEAGYHEEMILYHFQFDEGFTGGDIVVKTQVASGSDTRGGTVIENGEHGQIFTFTCHVTVEGSVPQPTEKTGAPTFNGYTTDGIHAYFVEIVPTEPSTIYYRVQYGHNGEFTEWATYDDILSFTQDGWYRVEAYAVANGKLASEQIAYEFVVSPITGLSEIDSNKTVASVRYFNMGGQEMQQASGMTIVVTTYTDGTTSAMKVMK